jgi:diadenylate cyclase
VEFGDLLHNLNLTWGHLGWNDFLDILLVWLVVYKLLTFIKGTGAVQILAGLGIVAISYILSIWLELSTLNWGLQQFFDNLFLIVIILFQAEIRRALAHIGRNPFFSNITATQEMEAIEELCIGAFRLSELGYGALIVIEKEIGLENYIEKGEPIDSQITNGLLISLFHPQSPLHDGAVVIRGGPNIDKQFGTRHRAALGITEETDAIVIVVSEERQQISLVEQGILVNVSDLKSLRSSLVKSLQLKFSAKVVQHG